MAEPTLVRDAFEKLSEETELQVKFNDGSPGTRKIKCAEFFSLWLLVRSSALIVNAEVFQKYQIWGYICE